jgi:hypothetical protein
MKRAGWPCPRCGGSVLAKDDVDSRLGWKRDYCCYMCGWNPPDTGFQPTFIRDTGTPRKPKPYDMEASGWQLLRDEKIVRLWQQEASIGIIAEQMEMTRVAVRAALNRMLLRD